MKNLALAFVAAAATLFGFGLVASAQSYSPTVHLPSAPTAGGGYSVVYSNCVVGETVTFNQAESTPTSVTGQCVGTSALSISGSVLGLLPGQQAVGGAATGTFSAAPLASGSYTGTAVGQNGTLAFSFVIPGQASTTTVAPSTTATASGQLPVTGSSGLGPTGVIAIGLFIVGAGLLIVAGVRRRQPTPT